MNHVVALIASVNVIIMCHTFVNLRLLRRPPSMAHTSQRVCVLIPARNEAAQIAACLSSVCDQSAVEFLSVVVLDDGSTDDTAAIAQRTAGDDTRVTVVHSTDEPPPGWLGKNWACHRLSQHELALSADILVFVDADVVLNTSAVSAAVTMLHAHHLDLVCPYPAQRLTGVLQHLVQPLLQWSWAATLPLRLAERSRQSSLSAGNGQFLVVDAHAYRRVGGHAAVAGDVLEDIALVRAFKRVGARGTVADGTQLAMCTMYGNARELIDGYTKSLWAATGSIPAAVLMAAVLTVVFIAPLPIAAAAAATSASTTAVLSSSAYVCAVVSRLLVARRTRGPVWSAFAHPAAIAIAIWLLGRSWRAKRAGRLMWKGRLLT